MIRRVFSGLVAALGAAGAVLFWNRRLGSRRRVDGPQLEEAPPSATSLSAQPHKRTRLVPPQPAKRVDVPAPDSAEEGRTPYYFVPGEALVALFSDEPLDETEASRVAGMLDATYLPTGSRLVQYPVPEGEGWYTIVRLHWPEAIDFDETLTRFTALEERVNQGVRWGESRVATWMPNWLGTIAADAREKQWFTPGGPGSYPRPVPALPGGLPLKDVPFLAELREGMESPVTLAILDAFPSPAQLDARPLPAALHPLAERLKASSDTLSLDDSRHYAAFRMGEPLEMGDHGLMTAWLASEVIGERGMEHVTLEPVRVASTGGVCSSADVIAGLAPLVERARAGENLVVLLAFVVGMRDIVPPRLRLYEEHYEALRLCCLALSEAGGILIGAAGNDASGLQHPPRTRRPAAFRSVIEVTAGQQSQGDLALYANQAKALCLFGGEANLLYEITENMPSLPGPSVSDEVRSSHGHTEPNPEGWVAWAGTSFAAALAAGLAVLLRSAHPEMKMWDVRTALRRLASGTRNPGNVPFIDLVQPYWARRPSTTERQAGSGI